MWRGASLYAFRPHIFFLQLLTFTHLQEPLHAAVMLEQASYCFVLTKPAMLHKYGFHLVLSGDHYKNCDQVHVTLLIELKLRTCFAFLGTHIVCLFQVNHAIRTYKSAISVYKSTTWSHIKDHIYFHIGQ